ncbi:MAG TPA: cytochrome c oxidase assembly factor Coa1 family protein [Anaerolineae bacterium]|nr:cytochrome c oxidase assembly factor Coa1 family protein [Anaerolineae bacterium]
MPTSFDCPSCGAALEPPTTPATSVQCHYCGTTVPIPEELRVHPAAPPPPPENITINFGTPQNGQVTVNVPADEYAKLAQLEQAEATMLASRRVRRSARGCSGCGCFFGLLFFVAFAGFMIFIFGFSIKNSVMYRCAVQLAESNPQVVKLIGTPIKADTFAWISNYSSSGSSESGQFTTQLSGPKGSGTLSIDGSHNRNGTDLDVTFETSGETVQVHSGPAQCR